ncbi:MAG: endonuclease/exonuclease/phosphatase family protein [Candidatus Cloacimonetes bacterium]|nr:endonuclease/exonuclease/phosphatase family protein [Candidatus Cloacimonadota bacterium]
MKKVVILVLWFWVMICFAENLPEIEYEKLNFGEDETLEIMTWNIQNFPKSDATVDYVTKIIIAIDADVIGLQEIQKDSAFVLLLKNLNQKSSENIWNGFRADTDKWEMNLAYIYKANVTDSVNVYEIYADDSKYHSPFPRKPLVLEFSYSNEKFYIINNHYKARSGEKNLKRRQKASELLDKYIEENLSEENVIILGDLNDQLIDEKQKNAFTVFLENDENYKFVDFKIAEDEDADWSYPYWKYRGHLDHILISNELFDEFRASKSAIKVITIDKFMEGNGDARYKYITDHRPVALKLYFPLMLNENSSKKNEGEKFLPQNIIPEK